jgi:hypothetical protein
MSLGKAGRIVVGFLFFVLVGGRGVLVQAAGGVDPKTLNYAEIGANSSGKVLYGNRSGTGAQAVLIAAMHDVEKILGTKVTITSAFDDKQKDLSGGANFTATVNGTAVKGSVLVAVGGNGASVSIIYANANAPAMDWSGLLADLPSSIKLTPTQFGNGVGTIGLPDGWSVTGSDNTGMVAVAGPNGEQVGINITMLVLAPGSPPAQQQIQFARLAMQYGHQPPAGRSIAPFADPAQTFENLTPYFSQNAVAHGQPSTSFKELIAEKMQTSQDPSVTSAMVYFRSTVNNPGQPMVRRNLFEASVRQLPPQLQGEWGFSFSGASAPDATFDKQLPTLLAVWNS